MLLEETIVSNKVKELEIRELEGQCSETDYAVLMASYLESGDLKSARFLWKRLPDAVKETTPDIQNLWQLGQLLWQKELVKFYSTAEKLTWSLSDLQPIVQSLIEKTRLRTCNLISKSYSSINEECFAAMVHLPLSSAINEALTYGWQREEAAKMLLPKKMTEPQENVTMDNEQKLQPLVNYVMFLEN